MTFALGFIIGAFLATAYGIVYGDHIARLIAERHEDETRTGDRLETPPDIRAYHIPNGAETTTTHWDDEPLVPFITFDR